MENESVALEVPLSVILQVNLNFTSLKYIYVLSTKPSAREL